LSALLNIKSEAPILEINESDFYKKIVKIPFMGNSYFKLFEEINVDDIVEDLVQDFRNIYIPVIEELNEEFKVDYIKFDNERNIFIIKNDYKSRKFFAENLNLEIIKCMHHILKRCT
jgi:hypothetical protein